MRLINYKIMCILVISLLIGGNFFIGDSMQRTVKAGSVDNDVVIIFPNGGEQLSGTEIIIWEYTILYGVYCPYFKVFLKRGDSIFILNYHFEDSSPDGYVSAYWNTTKIPNGEYGLFVELYGHSDWECNDEPTLLASDHSDGYFTITNNQPPHKPETPTGPTQGDVGFSYTYTTRTTDPEDDIINYGWDWDSDDIVDQWSGYEESGTIISASHTWYYPGSYEVKVKAKDVNNKESEWSNTLSVQISNTPPETPTITGPDTAKINQACTFTVVSNDYNNDDIYYLFDWYEGTNSGWLGPYVSGSPCTENHIFTEEGSYIIKAKVKDIHGAESNWTEHLIKISKTKNINNKKTEHLNRDFLSMYATQKYLSTSDDNNDYELISDSLSSQNTREWNHPFIHFFQQFFKNSNISENFNSIRGEKK